MMKCASMALSIFFFLSGSLSAQTAKPLLLGLASISGGIETLYVTKKIGAFKRNGLDVDFLLLQGGSQALQVLLSGEIKLISGGGGTAAQRARFKGAGNLLVRPTRRPCRIAFTSTAKYRTPSG
jgi:ABC-type nitrate/sulfonate/bicarbonate transport system substrate-binding protein